MKLSKRLIHGRAQVAIKRVIDDSYDGWCDPVCIEFCKLMRAIGYPTNGIARCKFLGEHPHYVALIDGNKVSFSNAETILVDPTIKQFQSELQKPINTVLILPSTDERYNEWYQQLEPITDSRLSQ